MSEGCCYFGCRKGKTGENNVDIFSACTHEYTEDLPFKIVGSDVYISCQPTGTGSFQLLDRSKKL